LNNRADVRSIATVCIALALLLVPQFVALPAALAVPWILIACLACCSSHVIVHNHNHRVIFAGDAANIAFNLLATLARGHCASDVHIAHNQNHHVEQGRSGDWIRPSLGGSGPPLARLARYVVRATMSMLRERRRLGWEAMWRLPQPFRTSVLVEKVFLPSAILLLALHDWKAFLLFCMLPWAASLAWLVGVNYVQHEGCDPESRYGHSRNFTGAFTNWLLFNNGYHTAHHLDPALHWSELPGAHRRIAASIPQELNEASAIRYMLRHYLLRTNNGIAMGA
jgi:fatty acid desaturase